MLLRQESSRSGGVRAKGPIDRTGALRKSPAIDILPVVFGCENRGKDET